jgi:hypothetical protein
MHQRAEASRLVAIATRSTGTTGTAATATTATPAAITTAAAATATTTIAATAIVTTTAARGSCDAIHDVVELATRDRVVRALLALIDADEAHLIDTVPDDVERLDQPRRAIRLHAERTRKRLHLRIAFRRRRHGLGLAGRRIARRSLGAFRAFCAFRGGRAFCAFHGGRAFCSGRAFCAFRGGAFRAFRCRLTAVASTISFGRAVSGGGLRLGRGSCRRRSRRAARGGPCFGRLPEGQRREFGERLHAGRATPPKRKKPGIRLAS